MAYDIGASVGITGEAEFKAAMQGINNEFKLLGSELKLATSAFDKNDKSAAALTAQNKVLGASIDSQKGKIALLTTQYDKQNSGLATLKTKLDATKAAFAADSAEVAKAQREYDKQNQAVIKLQTELNKAATSLNTMDRAFETNSKTIDLQNSGWTKFGASLDSIGTKMKTVGAGLSSAGKSMTMGLTVPILGAVAGLGALVMKSSNTADELQKMSDITGLSAERLQELKYAGSNLGVELETITGAQTKLTKAMFASKDGTGAQAAAFAALGLSVVDANGNMRDVKDVMGEAFTALNGVGNETERDAMAMQLFGKSGTALNPIIKAGGEGLKKLTDEARANGAVMSNEAVAGLDKFGDAVDAIKLSISGAVGTAASQLMPTLEKLGPVIQEKIVPAIGSFVQKISDLIIKFTELDPGTQKLILGIGVFLVTIGPIVGVIGAIVTAIGGLALAFGAVGGAMAVVTTGAVAGTPAIAALAGVFTTLLGPVGLAILAIGAVVVAGTALSKYLSAEVIPAVDLFGGQVSEATQKAVTAYMDLNTKVGVSLLSFQANNTVITSAIATETVATFAAMGEQIKAGRDAHYNEDLATLTKFYTDQGTINSVDAKDVLSKMQDNHTSEGAELTKYEAQIKLIWDTAANDHRELTQKEVDDIKAIKDKMQGDAITALSNSEAEQKVIMEKAKLEKTNISTLEASEVIKQSAKQRDETIAAANTQKAGVVDAIARQRAEGVPISDDQAANMIAAAEETRSESVRKAGEMHTAVVGELGNQNADVLTKLNESDGTVKTWWQDLGSWFANNPIMRYINTISSGYEADPTGAISWFDTGGVFNSPTIIGVGEKRPEFVGALDDLKYIVRSEIERSGGKGQLAGGDINITMPGMVIREEADIDKISRGLYNLLQQTSRGRGLAT